MFQAVLERVANYFGFEKRDLTEADIPWLTDGTKTDAGIAMSHTKSLQIAAVWQAITMLSNDIASYPFNIYKKLDKRGSRELDLEHPLQELISVQPNREMHAVEFWKMMMTHALMWGNGYAYISRNADGEIIELVPLLPDRTQAERDRQVGLYYVTEISDWYGEPALRTLMPQEVFHIHGVTVDGLDGLDILDYAKHSWAAALAAEKFTSRFFKHGVRSGGTLELPVGMGEKARNRVKEGFEKHHYGEDNWFKVVILRDGAKFHAHTIDPKAGQMLETRQEQTREVARWFNFPPSKLGLADASSYNSKSEDNQSYLDNTLRPWLDVIAAEGNIKLLNREQRRLHFLDHDTNTILRMAPTERFALYAVALQSRIMNRNEVRKLENLNPVDGGDEFDKAAGGAGMVPANEEPSANDSAGTDVEDGEADDAESDDSQERLNSLRRAIYDMTANVRHKTGLDLEPFKEWLRRGLQKHRTAFTKILGDDTLVDRLSSRLWESLYGDDWRAAVIEACTNFERSLSDDN